MSYTVRLAGPEDRGRIIEGIRQLLPNLDPTARYAWIYEGNPHGPALTWIAVDDETSELAGMTSFFRRRLVAFGREVDAALGGDGYVPPKFRRRGIASELHSASRRTMAERRIDVMFGTPLQANVTPLTKAGARTITQVLRYVRPLTGEALHLPEGPLASVATRLLSGSARGLRLDRMSKGDGRVDEIWRATSPELGIATIRDAAFYTWRFVGSPSQKQEAFVVVDDDEAIAACALERLDRRLRIVDLVAPKRSWGRALSAIAASSTGCDAIEIALTREDGTDRALWRHGFFARADETPFNVLVAGGASGPFNDPARWHFSWAETDLDYS